MSTRCNVCANSTSFLASAQILKKHNIQYFVCGTCGFVQTETPYWLAEAYSEPIIRSDIGLISRNLGLARIAALVIRRFFDPDARFLDFGAGNGMLVRLMRDRGYDFHWHDRHAKNEFAIGFEAKPNDQFELITAFEVFEHLPDPLTEIAALLKYAPNVLFSTLLVPQPPPHPNQWWYYALDGGQHISLYSKRSLTVLADRSNLHYCTDGRALHLFSKKQVSPIAFRLLTGTRLGHLYTPLTRKPSLLPADYFHLTGQQLE